MPGHGFISATIPPPPLVPAISPSVQLGLSAAYTGLYGILFLTVYIQLWMILYFKYKRLSHQTVFLFLCLIWAGLRTTLFSFYFKDEDAITANNLATPFYWLLYCFPVCLQFATLCLLVEFFAQVVFRTRVHYSPRRLRKSTLWILLIVALISFLATNISCAIIEQSYQNAGEDAPYSVTMCRVLINGFLFIIMSISLSICLYKISKTSAANMVLEARGITVCNAVVVCTLIVLLYISRALYNMIAICKPLSDKLLNFGYNWINVSDQVDIGDLDKGMAYVSFGIVLFVWEFLPTSLVVMFFRVKKPNIQKQLLTSITSSSYNRPRFFFDNPRRYDSDDDIRQPGDGSEGTSPLPITSITEVDFLDDYFGSYTHRDMEGTPPPFKITHDPYLEAEIINDSFESNTIQ